MTVKIFWEDPYLVELDAVVTSVEGDDVIVDRTVFYAFSGGQESDAGTIGGRTVVEAAAVGDDIVYTLDSAEGLRVGSGVAIRVDWPRRYRLMRLHFAAEIVLELMYRAFPGIVRIGAHISEQHARLDFTWGESIKPSFPGIMEEANRIIESDAPIVSAFSDELTGRRYWEVDGFARVPCGGTHLRRTGEVGGISLRRDNVGRGKERVVVSLVDQS